MTKLTAKAGEAYDLYFRRPPQPVARSFPRDAATGLTVPVQYWMRAIRWSGILIAAMAVLYMLESWALGLHGTPYRVVVNPAEMAARFFGFAHYTVATYLLFTSKKLHNVRGFTMLALFTALAIGGCYLFYLAGGKANLLAMLAVIFYFLMHGLRDETFFYRLRSGKAISDEEYPHVYRMTLWLQTGALCLLAGILYPAFMYKYYDNPAIPDFNARLNQLFPADWSLPTKMVASSVPFLFGAVFCFTQLQRKHAGGVWSLLNSHRPLAVIFGGTSLLAVSSIGLGFGMLNLIILTHFTGWFIFATAGIAKQPKEVRQAATWRQPNTWIRQNMVGFWVFHGGLAAMFFAPIATNHWVLGERPMQMFGRTMPNPLTLLFSESSFYYWTIIHVTLGFLPKPAPKRR